MHRIKKTLYTFSLFLMLLIFNDQCILDAAEPIYILKRKEDKAIEKNDNRQNITGDAKVIITKNKVIKKISKKDLKRAAFNTKKTNDRFDLDKEESSPVQIIGSSAKDVAISGVDILDKRGAVNSVPRPKKIITDARFSDTVLARIDQSISKSTISFVWPESVRAAVFVNRGRLWIVFDRYSDIDFNDSTQHLVRNSVNSYNFLNVVQRRIDERYTFITADLNKNLDWVRNDISVYKDGNSWIIEISNTQRAKNKIKLSAVTSDIFNSYLQIKTQERFLGAIEYTDPFTKRDMAIVPLLNQNIAVTKPRKFIELKALETAQGVAIEKVNDGLILKSIDNKSFMVTKQYGLNIAPKVNFIDSNDLSNVLLKSNQQVILNMTEYLNGKSSFVEQERVFKDRITRAALRSKNKTRLDLAMFYLAHGFYNEAKSIVEFVRAIDKSDKYQIILLDAVLDFMLDNYEAASNKINNIDVSEAAVTHIDEIRFWQFIIDYASDEKNSLTLVNNNKILANLANNFLGHYTSKVMFKGVFVVLENKFEKRLLKDAYNILEALKVIKNISSVDNNRLKYNLAKYHRQLKQNKDALGYYNECVKDYRDQESYNMCQYDRALLLLDASMIDNETFIEILERIRLRWDGDLLYSVITDELYNAYKRNNNLIDSLRVGRSFMIRYPGTSRSIEIKSLMSKDYINFFLQNLEDGNKLDPIKVLEVFFEFQELLPVGDTGDEIALMVVDNLYALDLLEPCMALLEHQVKNRLNGAKRELAINKLANIYLENMQCDKVIGLIGNNIVASNNLEGSLISERKYILAEAFGELGRSNDVTRLLDGDFSSRADKIKANAFWLVNDWNGFNNFSESYIYSIRDKNFILSKKDEEKISRQMISYLYTSDHKLLEDLYNDFKDRFSMQSDKRKLLDVMYLISKSQKLRDDKDIISGSMEMQQVTSNIIDLLKSQL